MKKTLLQEIRLRGSPLVVLSVLCCASVATFADTVDLAVQSPHWSIIRDASPTLRWGYPFGAKSAAVSVTDIRGKVVYTNDFAAPVVSCQWTAFSGTVPEKDTTFTCTIAFDDGSSQTASVALLKCVFDGSTTIRPEGTASWSSVGPDTVLPYEAGWMGETENPALVIAQKEGTKSIRADFASPAGFFGWSSKKDKMGRGWFDLTLSSGDGVLTAELNRSLPGLFLVVQ